MATMGPRLGVLLTVLCGGVAAGCTAPAPDISFDYGRVDYHDLAVPARGVFSGDFTGDGRLDVATLSGSEDVAVQVFPNAGEGAFHAPIATALTNTAALRPTPNLTPAPHDFDGDGHVDLMLVAEDGAYPTDCSWQLLRGRGDGTFEAGPWTELREGSVRCFATAAGDVNADGLVDVVFSHYLWDTEDLPNGHFAVLFNRGGGAFEYAPGGTLGGGTAPYRGHAIALADMNGDRATDVVVGHTVVWVSGDDNWRIEVFSGAGDGTFAPGIMTPPPVGVADARPTSLAIADYNGDARLDVTFVARDREDDEYGFRRPLELVQLLGNGDGTFAPAVRFGFTASATDAHASDLDGNGTVDLLAVNERRATVSYYEGLGDGGFAAAREILVPNDPLRSYSCLRDCLLVDVADFDGDSRGDLAVVGPALPAAPEACLPPVSSLSIIRNTAGAPPFPAVITTPVPGVVETGSLEAAKPWRSPAVGDLNADGWSDFVVSDYPGLRVLLNDGSGRFAAGATYALPHGDHAAHYVPAAGDLNGDAVPDVVVANEEGVFVLAGTGAGTFAPPLSATSLGAIIPHAAHVADVDGNGVPDVLFTPVRPWLNDEAGVIAVYLNDGAGNLTALPPLVSEYPTFVLGDANDDRRADIAVRRGASLSIQLGDGVGHFNEVFTVSAGNGSFRLADMDGDDTPDLVSASAISLGRGDGTFQSQKPFTSPAGAELAAVADLNGDGRLDLVLGGRAGLLALRGNGDGTVRAAEPMYPHFPISRTRVGNFAGTRLPDILFFYEHEASSDAWEYGSEVAVLTNRSDDP